MRFHGQRRTGSDTLNAALTSHRPDDATLAASHRSIVPNTWSQSVVLTP
jgi:hypothetical protein